ncbi:hypothetical protein VTI74DRAFT_4052 [Chaetomium olivicolor]
MGILAFFWRGSMLAARQADAGVVWRAIAFAGWAPRTTTICAAALRITITAQAALVASMVASLLLERCAVPLHSAPFLSIIRAVGVQPVALLCAQGREVAQSSALLCLPILCLAGLVTMAVQSSMLAFTIPPEASGLYGDIFKVSPKAYPRFAEYREPPVMGDAFDDAGFTFRALLPFEDSGKRTSLRRYEGPASVFDARVICVSPALEIYNLTAYLELFIAGRITFDRDYFPGLRVPDKTLPMDFLCALPGFDYNTQTPWNTSVCTLGFITTEHGNSDKPATGYPYLVSPLPGGTRLQLVFNVTAPRRSWRAMTGYNETFFTSIVHAGPATVGREGPWSTATFADAEGARIACFTGRHGYEYQIAAASDRNGPAEPEITWTGGMQVYPSDWTATAATAPAGQATIPDMPSYETAGLRRQLGALQGAHLSPLERGILELDYASINWSRRFPGNDGGNNQVLYGMFDFAVLDATQPSSPGSINNTSPPVLQSMPTSLMAYNAQTSNGLRTHWAHVAVFVDSLVATSSPAIALQAWFTTLFQLQYMDEISRFSVESMATYVFSATALVPGWWAGFVGVAVMVMLHLLLTGYVTAWYLLCTRHTILGNGWQAVAQVASDATLPLLWHATGVGDRDVKEKIRDTGASGRKYRIVQSWAEGRRELSPVS